MLENSERLTINKLKGVRVMRKILIIIGLLLMMGCYGGVYPDLSGGYKPPTTYIKSGDDFLLGSDGSSCIVSNDLVICN